MVNSIKKGKNYEREVCKYLKEKLNIEYMRIPQSGGMATNYNLQNFQGDIVEKEVMEGKKKQDYIIECKSYNELELNELFNEKSKLYKFIDQSESEANGKDWFLFIKAKNKGQYLVYPLTLSHQLLMDFLELLPLQEINFDVNYYMIKIK